MLNSSCFSSCKFAIIALFPTLDFLLTSRIQESECFFQWMYGEHLNDDYCTWLNEDLQMHFPRAQVAKKRLLVSCKAKIWQTVLDQRPLYVLTSPQPCSSMPGNEDCQEFQAVSCNNPSPIDNLSSWCDWWSWWVFRISAVSIYAADAGHSRDLQSCMRCWNTVKNLGWELIRVLPLLHASCN